MNGPFWPWWLGGLSVGLLAASYPLVSGRLLGVSSLYAALFDRRPGASLGGPAIEQALLEATRAEFGSERAPDGRTDTVFGRWRDDAERFRPLFMVGMVAGAAAARASTGNWEISWSLGQRFDARYGQFGVLPLAILLASGIAIGFGTRLGAGCTSGHGISGVARGQAGSLVTTSVFWATALAVTWLLVLFRGLLS